MKCLFVNEGMFVCNFQNQYVYREIDGPRMVGIDCQFNTIWNNTGEKHMGTPTRDSIG